MFLDVASTHTKCIMNDFALAPRTDLLNLRCHTVTNGTDLKKSPLLIYPDVKKVAIFPSN